MILTFWDTETTGMLKPEHRIVELSMRVYCTVRRAEIKEKLWRFNPERNIDARAFAVHGIALDELKDKPLIKDCIPDIIKVISVSDYMIAHNGDGFDVPFLQQEVERCGFEFPKFKAFDTMVHGNFASELGKSPSLRELAWAMGVEYDPAAAHKGDYDTAVLRDATVAAIDGGWINLGE